MKKHIAFIIISYHPNKDELYSLLRQIKGFPVIIVDNGGTLTFDDVGSRVTLLSQSENHGYGAGANIGIRYASGIGTEWFVILNQDLCVTKDAVGSLSRQLRKLPPCVAGPFGAGLDPKRWTTILPSERADYITGSCLAIHEKVVSKIGYFFEPYFLYYEDVDYCIRAKQAGFPLSLLSIDGINHIDSVSLGKGSFAHQYYLTRNHMLFIWRLAPRTVKLYEILRVLKTISEHIIRREKSALIGLKDFVFQRFGMIRKGGV